MYQIRCKETGDSITGFKTLKDAEYTLESYAIVDMDNDCYEGQLKGDIEKYKEFYEIVEVSDD